MPSGRGGERIGRHRHAAQLSPAALPATAAGEEGALGRETAAGVTGPRRGAAGAGGEEVRSGQQV